MKLKNGVLVLASVLLSYVTVSAAVWQKMESNVAPVKTERTNMPEKYLLYAAAESTLKSMLTGIADNPDQGQIIGLPMPDGSMMDFKVWKNDLMAPDLAAKYPDIQAFTAVSVKDSRITAKLDYTVRGFHAMVFNGDNTAFIDPYAGGPTDYYISYYRNDYDRPLNERMVCAFNGGVEDGMKPAAGSGTALKTIGGNLLRKYRLALACTGEYAAAVGGTTPTKVTVLSAMVTTMNRVNGVYERELAVTLQLISNTDNLIYLDGATDPYTNNDGPTMLNENQTNVTTVIGGANYDIGHVFSTGGGGIAGLAALCTSSGKARGVTGSASPTGDAFDIDYVAHEMGHQFGSDHTFNNNVSGACGGNAASQLAYEPGSGSTIMAYAGICSPDNVQAHSDFYFHAKSLANIINNITSSSISSCPVTTTSGNKSVSLAAFTHSYSIPYKTPFELTAPQAVDSVASTDHTYCWEQWNLGDFGARFSLTYLKGPITRSYSPDTSRTRIFPALVKLLANTTAACEKLPDTARFLTYKLTARSFVNGVGSVYTPDDTIHLDVINTGAPFMVTSPNGVISWTGNTTQTVTWNVSNTTASPISCATVDIFLSVDGGYTYPYTLKTGAANNGTATITVPNISTTKARVKVKGAGNVFFDISNFNFIIVGDGQAVAGLSLENTVKVYPVPATSEISIVASTQDKLQALLTDQLGRAVWSATMVSNKTIPVSHLARGVYYLKVNNPSNGAQLTKKIALQ